MSPATVQLIAQILAIVPLLIRGVAGAADNWNEANDLLARVLAEDRDPTPEEIEGLRQKAMRLNEEIQNL